nr:Nif3-like dinuclear metal center hexameric protein [Vagococcus sp. B2T-5]
MLTGEEFIQYFESVVPKELAEDGDPVGLHIGTLNKPIKRVMMTLDVRPAVVREAIEKNVDLIIAKHPPIFRPIKRLTTDDFQTQMFADLLSHNIAVYAAHTNMDIVNPGLNDWFCDLLGLHDTEFLSLTHRFPYKKLVLFTPTSHAGIMREMLGKAGVGEYGGYDFASFSSSGVGRFRPSDMSAPFTGEKEKIAQVEEQRQEFIFPERQLNIVKDIIQKYHPYEVPAYDIFNLENMTDDYGLGRIGKLAQPMSLDDTVTHVKQVFGLNAVTLVTDTHEKMIETIAICGGSGEKFYKDALKKGADLYITGDVYFHTAHDMIEEGLSVIDPGHYIESICKEKYVEMFNEWKDSQGWDVDFIVSQVSTNPFEII